MSDGKDDDNTPWTHQPYGQSPDQPPAPPAYPTNPYADPQQPTGQPPQGQPQWGQQPYQAPQYPQPAFGQPYGQQYPPQFQTFPVVPNHPSANTALILGIVALGGAFVCLLPIVVGPFAWFMGAKVRREIDAEPQRYAGRSEASAGMILGIISTVLLVLGILAFVAIIAIAVGTSSTSG